MIGMFAFILGTTFGFLLLTNLVFFFLEKLSVSLEF
jgi:hypothetical protein